MATLLGARETPPFDILQMILEGPRGYFGRRGQESDALWMADQEQKRRGMFAEGLLQTPQYNAAMDNPYDRRAQFGLWGAMQGGPEATANTGNALLSQSLGAIYGREQTSFEDQLAKSRITLGTDEAIRLENAKVDIENKQLQKQWDMVFGTDPTTGQTNLQSQLQKDGVYSLLASKHLLPPLPEGYSVTQGPDGQFAFTPTPGTAKWVEAMDALKPVQTIGGATDQLLAMMTGKDAQGQTVQYNAGQAQQLIQIIQDAIRKGQGFGSLDAGTAEALKNYIPQVGSVVSWTPGTDAWFTGMEKLRGLQLQSKKMIADWQRTYLIDPKSQNVGDPYAYKGEDRPPVPDRSADTAIPAPEKPGSVGAGGRVSTWFEGDTELDRSEIDARLKRERDALRKKFPKARIND